MILIIISIIKIIPFIFARIWCLSNWKFCQAMNFSHGDYKTSCHISIVSDICTVYWVLCTGYWVLCIGYCVLGTGCCVLGILYRVLCTGYCVQGAVYWVLCTGCCVLGTVYRVPCTVYRVLCTVSWNIRRSWITPIPSFLRPSFIPGEVGVNKK
jgi:hypothetical protein